MKVKDTKQEEVIFGKCDIPFYLTTVQGIDDHFNESNMALGLSGKFSSIFHHCLDFQITMSSILIQ